MKNFTKVIAVVLAVVCLAATLVACSNISQSYADKINKAAEKKEYLKYDDVKEDLGEDVVDISIEILGSRNGVLIAVKGCDSVEDIKEQLDDGKTVKGIVVTILNGNATAAEYKEITDKDLK